VNAVERSALNSILTFFVLLIYHHPRRLSVSCAQQSLSYTLCLFRCFASVLFTSRIVAVLVDCCLVSRLFHCVFRTAVDTVVESAPVPFVHTHRHRLHSHRHHAFPCALPLQMWRSAMRPVFALPPLRLRTPPSLSHAMPVPVRWLSTPSSASASTSAGAVGSASDRTLTWTRTFTDADVKAFAAVSGDHNPIHLDEHAAANTRFKQVRAGHCRAKRSIPRLTLMLPVLCCCAVLWCVRSA
jgi:hypothetical protein